MALVISATPAADSGASSIVWTTAERCQPWMIGTSGWCRFSSSVR